MSRHKTEREIAAEQLIKQAFDLFVEARKDVTLYGFEEYIRDHIADVGSIGFVDSIGRAIVRAAEAAEKARKQSLQKPEA